MGLTLPAALTEPISWVGPIWPEADEDLLFQAGQRWIAYGSELAQMAARAEQSAAKVWNHNDGESVEAFRAWWNGPEGPAVHLIEDAAAAEIIGAALIVFAVLTLALKIAFIIQLAILLVEVVQATVTMVVSLGATAAEVPGFIAATRVICRTLIRKAVTYVKTVVRNLLLKARNLLRRAEARAARRAARHIHGRAVGPGGTASRLPSDLLDALRRANPGRARTEPEWTNNCTNCVTAYELRRRGLDAEAVAVPRRYRFGGRPDAVTEREWGVTLSPSSQADVVRQMTAAGPGARGFVGLDWTQGGGHIFSVENVSGKIHFIDPQSNVSDAASYFTRGSGVVFSRVDNVARPSDAALTDWVTITPAATP